MTITKLATRQFSHDLLSAAHTDALAGSVAAGDILYGNATPKWARLAKGTDGQVLSLSSGLPSWQDAASGSSFGTTTQIPYMNAGGTDFLYSANLVFDGSKLTVTGDIKVSNFIRYLDADTLGTNNLFLGLSAGANNASGGNYNVAIGKEANQYNVTGDNNVCIGYQAGRSSGTYNPSNNVFIGYQAGLTVNSKSNNVGIGSSALKLMSSGYDNIAIGYSKKSQERVL